MSTDRVTREAYKRAWEMRRALNANSEEVDNGMYPAGTVMVFRCPSCYADIILQEGYLTKPKVCYDCRDLLDRGLIFEMPPPGTGWNWIVE
jgi:hypothetical protein